jgi:hypothetical protein
MRDYGIDKGSVRYLDDSKRDYRGWSKGFWGFRKMFRDYLTKLNVAFFDECCPAATEEGMFPVRYNELLGRLEYFNGTAWIDIAGIVETTTTTSTTSTSTSSTTTTTTAP